MNERIRELATEVGISVEYLTNTKQIVLIEKFAELIVKECAGLAEDGFDNELDGQEICDRIKQHFGV